MNCPECKRELLDMPVMDYGYGATYRLCLDCDRRYTLDMYEVIEPQEFWACVGRTEETSAEFKWIKRWKDPNAHSQFTEEEWKKWFEETWVRFHPDG